jgi:ATP-binding cassette, subfamily B, bacterial
VSNEKNLLTEAWNGISGDKRQYIADLLDNDEAPLCWFEPDLNLHLQYRQGLIVLTNRRLISIEPTGKDGGAHKSSSRWQNQSWFLTPGITMRTKEQAGVGTLELIGPTNRLAHWRYTLKHSTTARRFVERIDGARKGLPPPPAEKKPVASGSECPNCGEVLAPEHAACPVCGALRPKPPVRSLYRVVQFARARMGMVILGFFLQLASTAAALIPAYLTMPLLDKVLIPYLNDDPDVDFGLVKWYLLGMVGASLLGWMLSWVRTYVLAWVSERIAADLRNKTYAHLQRLSLEFFGSKRTGDLVSRISTDSDRICYFLSVHLLDFANDVLMIAMTSVMLVSLNPWLALTTLSPVPLIAILIYLVRTRLRKGFTLGNLAWSEMTSVLADTIPGIRVVKAFAQEQREIDRFHKANDRVLQAQDRTNKLWAFFGTTVTLLTDLGEIVIWVFCVFQIWNRFITIGEMNLFLQYIRRFYGRLDSMSRMSSATSRAGASAQRVFSILDRKSTVPEPAKPVRPENLQGEIEFRNVGFQYGTRPVLHEVSLKIRPGEMIGLVGHSGAGKTTMINLMCRFFDVADGAILVDGTDLRSFPVEEYRRNIGIVLQEPFLFYGSISENIAYGRPDARREEIIAAARAARAHEFILRLPDAYDSLVGERGQFLSGGERQRISIARALLINPRILILDEATSSVDTETEREIQMALENLIRGRTTIAIAHRLSTLRRADRLVVVEKGRVVEVGPHHDLLESAGAYARLYHAQFESPQPQSA